jgi:hypothetical protein
LPEEERVVREIEQDENIEGNRNTAANNNRIKSVESGEEILRAENIANIVTAEKGNSGIVIRIKSLEKLEYLPAVIILQLRKFTLKFVIKQILTPRKGKAFCLILDTLN